VCVCVCVCVCNPTVTGLLRCIIVGILCNEVGNYV